ncbi:MAG: hypothetical protein OEV91_09240 [Desulfobulbaceae bacterium]|nr:hypothetical protein [Desulfobulbaceae bacterium]
MVSAAAVFLIFAGAAVTVSFWVPRLCNRARLKELLGSRYPLLYVVYVANGPLLMLLGLWLFVTFG